MGDEEKREGGEEVEKGKGEERERRRTSADCEREAFGQVKGLEGMALLDDGLEDRRVDEHVGGGGENGALHLQANVVGGAETRGLLKGRSEKGGNG